MFDKKTVDTSKCCPADKPEANGCNCQCCPQPDEKGEQKQGCC